MSIILKVYTKDQLFDMFKGKILSDNVGLTDFNSGSKIRTLLESNSEIISAISIDHKEAIYKAIPIALYEGFGFEKIPALSSSGFIRPYRKPAIWIKYTGSGTSAKVTTNATDISSAVIGAPADAFSFDYATYDKTSDIVTAIDALSNWSATLVKDVNSDTLYQYNAEEVIGSMNYLYGDGFDLMLSTDPAITVPVGYSVTIDNNTILTTSEQTILAGDSGVQCPAEFQTEGTVGNISANSIDTAQGKGYINSVIDGIENVINDTAFSGGATEETDEQRKTRFSESVNSLNAGTKDGILSAIRTIAGVRSAGMRTSFPFKGTNTIIVDDGTETISAELLAAVEKVLYGDPNDIINYPGKNAEGIGYTITAPTIVDVNISVSVLRLPNVSVDLTEISTDVQTSIEQYVNTRGLGENVLLSEIIRVAKNSNAAVYDITISSPLSNIAISENEFSKTGSGTSGTVNVTVSIATSI